MEEVRVDKWLWAARFFKSRTMAATACAGGKVDVNGQSVKASRSLRLGDQLEITLPHGKRIVRVVAHAERRGSGLEAARLYEDLTPPAPPKEMKPRPVYRAPGSGRPTKRERRMLDRLRG